MKRTALILSVILLCSLFACGKEKSASAVNVAVLKGPSSIGMVKFISDADSGAVTSNDFSFEIYANADEIVPLLVQGEIDIAALPANLSSVLHNNTQGGLQVLAISTLGMMYVVENGDSINSLEDLRGKTVYAGFKGKSPEYDLNYILSSAGLDGEVNIEWKSEHTECVAALTSNENTIAVLPQPFVTIAQSANSNARIAVDLNHEWSKLQESAENPSALVTGVVAARREFIAENPDAVADFLIRYSQSAEYANENPDDTAAIVGQYEIFTEEIAKKAIPFCNITYIEGQEMRTKLSGYLSVLFEQNPQSIGGALPDDEFYYAG